MTSIDKIQFLFLCLSKEMYTHKSWMTHAFSLTRKNPYWDEPLHPYKSEGKWYVHMEKDAEPIEITGSLETEQGLLFHKKSAISVPAGIIPGIAEAVDTFIGRVIYHCITKVYPFGDKIKFRNDKHNNRDIESEIAVRLTSDVENGQEEVPDKIYVRELLKFTEAAGMYLASLSQLFTPAATEKSLTVDPKVLKRRDELLEINKDKLTDPAVIAGMKRELLEMDRESFKGDAAEDYLIGKKSFNIIRMKTMIMHGEENAFGDGTSVKFIPTSLDEGWDLAHFPDYVNSAREGSYNRGYQTMLGGEAFSFLSRIFQNTAIVEEDCGRSRGRHTFIPAGRAKEFVGYFVLANKKPVELTEENIGQVAGKRVELRSAMYCQTGGGNFCATCMGRGNARFPKAIGTMVSDFGSMILLMFLGKAHATELKTVTYDPFTAIT